MKRIISIVLLVCTMSMLGTTEAKSCNWWGRLWTDCEDKSPKDFACYGEITIWVELDGPGAGGTYMEVSYMSGNRIDCVVGTSGCSEESKC